MSFGLSEGWKLESDERSFGRPRLPKLSESFSCLEKARQQDILSGPKSIVERSIAKIVCIEIAISHCKAPHVVLIFLITWAKISRSGFVRQLVSKKVKERKNARENTGEEPFILREKFPGSSNHVDPPRCARVIFWYHQKKMASSAPLLSDPKSIPPVTIRVIVTG